MRPVAVDLFAGVGGMSLGFEQAGFDVVAAVEIDPIHAAAHLFNFPDCAVIPRSVMEVTGQEIREVAGLGDRQVDIVFGGPPCQGFSMIGKRQLEDPRNGLLLEFLRIGVELDASYLVMENVKGLTVGKHRKLLEELAELLNEHGYDVRSPWRVLDAAEYGVPQHRQRLFLIAAKKGLTLPEYPAPICYPADRLGVDGLSKGPTCAEAIGDIPDVDDFLSLKVSDQVRTKSWGKPSGYAQQMRCSGKEGWHFGHQRSFDPALLTSSMSTTHTDISVRRFSETFPGKVEPISRFYRLAPDGLCNTLRAGTDGARGAFTSPRPIHYAKPRCITVREMARLHGFPDWFRMSATKWHGARQIGNAVPPPLARAVARSIIDAMGISPVRPEKLVDLGDVDMLRFDLTKAANFLGVAKPPSRRDQKSGSKKRKQIDIEFERLRLAAE